MLKPGVHADRPTLQDVVGLIESCLQVSPLKGSDWLMEGLLGDGFLSINDVNVSQTSNMQLLGLKTCWSHLDGDDWLELLILDPHSFGGSLSVKLSVGYHRTDYMTHARHLQEQREHHPASL